MLRKINQIATGESRIMMTLCATGVAAGFYTGLWILARDPTVQIVHRNHLDPKIAERDAKNGAIFLHNPVRERYQKAERKDMWQKVNKWFGEKK